MPRIPHHEKEMSREALPITVGRRRSHSGKRYSGLHINVVIADDFPLSIFFGNNLEQSGMEAPFVVQCYSRGTQRCPGDGRQGLDDRDIRPYEFERDDVLLYCRILENACEDHFMLLEKGRMPGEELSPDVGEGSGEGEGARVANRVSLVPRIRFELNDVSNCGFIRRELSACLICHDKDWKGE